MRVLVTTSRMPFGLGLIRRLAEAGNEVLASDSYEVAPGSHSRYVSRRFVTAPARSDPAAFCADVERIAREQAVDVIVPTWEDVFYLSTRRERLGEVARLYAAPFPSLARLHDKWSFAELVSSLGIPVPTTAVARSDAELREAIARFPRYFARAAFSRGGVALLTNTGPLAGHLSPDDVHPSPDSPWLVQEFVDGPMLCTYSTLHDGRATAHCAYRAPLQWQHSTGIQFESLAGGETLAHVERIGGELGYTGQISFDFVDAPDGLRIIECNPRTTDGVLLMSPTQLAGGVLDDSRPLELTPPGELTQLDFAVFAELFTEGLRQTPRTIRDLIEVRGADRGWHDALPTLYSFLALAHHERLNIGHRKALLSAMSADVCWDGEDIPGMTPEDAAALRRLRASGP
ncbi:MAG: hypothetical protein ACM3UV_01480 [Nocardioidaceae bacterium]